MVNFLRRRVFGIKERGCRVDAQTGQSVQFMPHSGDISYRLDGDDVITKKSEILLSRERMLNPSTDSNLNEIGQNKKLVKRVQKYRYLKLD